MALQRNLFPRRPSPTFINGPTVLRTTNDFYVHKSKKKTKKSKPNLVSQLLLSTALDNYNKINDCRALNVGNNSKFQNSTVGYSGGLISTSSSSGPSSTVAEMISRRRILSRSRDGLNHGDTTVPNGDDEEDVWYSRDKLYKDHIYEILHKWDQIDDEIWAKIICMERNRRVAKAYARAPILTINGCDNGFDGYRIGLNGFDNPMRDAKVDDVKRSISMGIKVKMDDDGNIMIKRISKSPVYVKGWVIESDGPSADESGAGISGDLIKSAGVLEMQKSMKLFDMKKFNANVQRELRCAYPDRRKLESQCICCIAFGKDSHDMLDLPVWVMIINIVALDMLKSKLPPLDNRRPNNLQMMFDRPKGRHITEEDPYTLPSSGNTSSSSGTSGNAFANNYVHNHRGVKESGKLNRGSRPPKLPPRDHMMKGKMTPVDIIPKPDYDDDNHENIAIVTKKMNDIKKEDPYYCGFSARVPNFAKKSLTPLPEQQLVNPSANGSSKQDPPIVKKAHSRGIIKSVFSRKEKNSKEQSPENKKVENDPNEEIDPYIEAIRADNNDIYGIHRLMHQSKYDVYGRLSNRNGITQNREYIGNWE